MNYLANMLINEKIGSAIAEVTQTDPGTLISDFKEIREIRNIVAHNRTVSRDLSIKFDHLYEKLNIVIDKFKDWLIYRHDSEIMHEGQITDNKVIDYFNFKLEGNDWKYFQAFIAESKYLYEIVHLPAGQNASYLDISVVLTNFHRVIGDILGFFVNKMGEEYSIKWPKHESIETYTQLGIIDIFYDIKNDIWTDTPYEKQDSKFTCNPKVWFYENRRPEAK